MLCINTDEKPVSINGYRYLFIEQNGQFSIWFAPCFHFGMYDAN
jgi:hypothetical protein